MREDWKTVRLGDVCDIYQPKTISKKEMVPDGDYVVFGANGIIGRYNQYNHEKPQLLITCHGATCGSVNISEPKSWVTGNAMVIRPVEKDLSRRFLEYLFRGAIDISSVITGAAQPQITRKSLAPTLIAYPSFSEQERIVAILDEAFAAIATATTNAEKNLANARESFTSKRDALLEDSNRDWANATLGNLVTIKHGFAFRSEGFVDSSEFVLLTPGNFFEEGGYRDRGSKQKYYSGDIPNGFVLSEGDFLVAMTEQAAGLLGSPLIVPESNRFLHNQRLGLVQPLPGFPWCSGFFFHIFNTRSFRMKVHADASGVKVQHTSPKKLYRINARYPETLADQRLIAMQLNDMCAQCLSLEAKYERKLGLLAELKQSILHKAFTGELTADPKAADRTLSEAGI